MRRASNLFCMFVFGLSQKNQTQTTEKVRLDSSDTI
jgi:hypothetical protein